MDHWTDADLKEHYRKQGEVYISPGKTCPDLDTTLPKKRRGVPNKWESEYGLELYRLRQSGFIKWYGFEAMRLRLADGCHYTPDFTVVNADGTVTFHEVKGHVREAAMVRFKVAVEQFPNFCFMMMGKRLVKDGGGWYRMK